MQDLNLNFPITDAAGNPTQYFIRFLQDRGIGQSELEKIVELLKSINIVADAPITGGGILGDVNPVTPELHIGHETTLVVPGTYGDTGFTPKLVIDEFGHIQAAMDVPAAGGLDLEEGGTPVAGGPFGTLNFNTGATVTDMGGGVADIDISGGGGGSGGAAVGARVYNNGTQAIANTTVTVVTFNSEDFDTSSIHDTGSNTSRMVAPVTGNYRVSYSVPWDGNTGGSSRIAFLRKNAAGAGTDANNVIGSTTKIVGIAAGPSNVLTIDLPLTAGDYLELFLYQDSGGSRNIGSTVASPNAGSVVSLSLVLLSSQGSAVAKACRTYLSSNITGVNFTAGYIVPWNSGNSTELYDNGNWHDPATNPSRFTVPAGVTYVDIMFSLHLANVGGANNDSVISIYKNGAPINSGGPAQLGKQFQAGGEMYFTLTALGLPCAPGDYFEARIYANDASADLMTTETSFTIREANVLASGAVFRGALVKKSADQTGANFTGGAAITWNAEEYDTDNIHDPVTNNTRLTVPAGVSKVRLSGQIYTPNMSSNTDISTYISKNTAAPFIGWGGSKINVVDTAPYTGIGTAVIVVTPGDYFEMHIFTSDPAITVDASGSWFAMEIVE